MKDLSKREKILLITMLFICVFYIYFRFFLDPVLNRISNANVNIINYYNQLNSLNQAKINNKKLETQLQLLNVKFENSVKALPLSERDPEITYRLKELADGNGVVLKSVEFGQPTAYSDINTSSNANTQGNKSSVQKSEISNTADNKFMFLPANVVITGDYENIIKFIAFIEQDDRIAEVDAVNISEQNTTIPQNNNTVPQVGTNLATGNTTVSTDSTAVPQTGSTTPQTNMVSPQNNATTTETTISTIQANIKINYYYVDKGQQQELNYDFNTGNYGKSNLFK